MTSISASLSGKRILLIIGGGIAAYKSLDLIRRHLPEFGRDLRQLGHGSVAFSFAGQGGDRQPAPQTPHVRFGETAAEPRFTAPAAMPAPSRREGTSALDIRL